jgi:hypothetical protein
MHSTHVTGIVLLIGRGGAWTGPPAIGAHPTRANTTRSAVSGIHQFITSLRLRLILRAYPQTGDRLIG